LDPASSEAANKVIKAKRYFDEATNGLEQKWKGSIWMNPPYAQPLINNFIDKLETEEYEQAIVLVNNATETKWGQKLLSLSAAVCFHSPRIRFVSVDGELGDAPLQGQMICYIGANYKEFITEFKQYGICLRKTV
jgi:ParB family chromosome partitioning protein